MSQSWVYIWLIVVALEKVSAEEWDLCFLYVPFHYVNN
jgi:hypothetical protein